MHLLSIIISLASILLINCVAALPTNSTLVSRATAKQTQCFKEGAVFPRQDLEAYAKQLETVEFDKLLFIPHGRFINGVHNRVKVCAYNTFDKENTSVMNGVVATALYKILDKCCKPDEFLCKGGYGQESGQPKLFVDFVTRSITETCNKPFD
ncbi:MAG: hypothetical protein L6R36_002248 [Xanthoria steineri]|nr:MAG: hypothetical protein L6R36_002248 [Xanthoria steineri]